ncbi:MAG: glycosyltransferase [Acidobacteria bacterium]|nr:glycosyltransferase [Acidobacteriota bacterium]
MNYPPVSVIVAVRNGERFLEQALQSIRKQTLDPFEILVIDGRSTDRTADIARSFSQVRYHLQAGKGIGDAYNCGIQLARGELIAFLSHDDLWTPDKLETQVTFMVDHPEVDFSLTHMRFFLEPGESPPPGFRKSWLVGDQVGQIMETLMVRPKVFAHVGLFDTALSTGEDLDWFARVSDLGLAKAVIPQVLLHKRIHSTNLSLTTTENNQNMLAALRRSILRKRHD